MSHSFSNLFHMSSSMSTSTIWFLKAGQQRKFHTQDADGQHNDTDLFNKNRGIRGNLGLFIKYDQNFTRLSPSDFNGTLTGNHVICKRLNVPKWISIRLQSKVIEDSSPAGWFSTKEKSKTCV